jgi:hypothetical protein
MRTLFLIAVVAALLFAIGVRSGYLVRHDYPPHLLRCLVYHGADAEECWSK